jgi:hypothetical protein
MASSSTDQTPSVDGAAQALALVGNYHESERVTAATITIVPFVVWTILLIYAYKMSKEVAALQQQLCDANKVSGEQDRTIEDLNKQLQDQLKDKSRMEKEKGNIEKEKNDALRSAQEAREAENNEIIKAELKDVAKKQEIDALRKELQESLEQQRHLEVEVASKGDQLECLQQETTDKTNTIDMLTEKLNTAEVSKMESQQKLAAMQEAWQRALFDAGAHPNEVDDDVEKQGDATLPTSPDTTVNYTNTEPPLLAGGANPNEVDEDKDKKGNAKKCVGPLVNADTISKYYEGVCGENGSIKIKGIVRLAYGCGNSFISKTIKPVSSKCMFTFNNKTFGDPSVGMVKGGFVHKEDLRKIEINVVQNTGVAAVGTP